MHLIELFELIENGEDGQIEFKRKFSTAEKIAKEMIAFANTKGGKIIFGVNDDRSVIGVESEKGEIELIDMAAKFYCEPGVDYECDIIPYHRKDVIVIDVKESRQKPHYLVEHNGTPQRNYHYPPLTKGGQGGSDGMVNSRTKNPKVYIRIKDKSVLASKETVKILKRSNPDAPPLIFSLGEREKYLLNYLSNNDRVTVSTFRKLLNLSERRASRILVNLVRAELIRLHSMEKEDFYTLS
jgi:predicted HTH transcriptional regulator